MTTRFVGHPFAADNLVGCYPSMVNGRAVLVFINSGTRQAIWTTKAPQGVTGTLTAVIDYIATVTTGSFTWAVEVEAIAEGDTVDLDSATSFDSANSAADTVPSTAGYLAQHEITLTNNDAAGGVFVWDYHPADVAESGHFVVQFTANYDSPPTPARTIAESWEVYAALGE